MLVTRNPQPSLWESILPEVCLRMPPELVAVDALLDDPAFFEPYRRFFHPVLGRPSIPLECYLRLMFLKSRHKLSYEQLCAEVADSISWQRFCRIAVAGRVPHPTTLMKTTTRCGSDAVDALNEALLAKAYAAKVIKTDKVRADTTVVEANVAYPTDSGLLAKAVARIGRLVAKVHAAGGATRTKVRDRSRSAGRRAREIASKLKLRNDDAKTAVLAITGELADLATLTTADAQAVLRNARRALRRAGIEASGRLRALVDELDTLIARTGAIVDQTRQRLAGDAPPGATRVVSLHDPDARPIAKGRLGKPVEFGFKAQVVDNTDGVVLDHNVEVGNPPDAPQLAPAIERIKTRFGRAPRAVTADRGYGEAGVEADLEAAGVTKVVIPRKGKPGVARRAHEHARPFRRLVKWRTGSEGRISHLKHSYRWDRTLLDGIAGARTWCGLGIFAHNTVKIAGLVDTRDQRRAERAEHRRTPDPAAASPPPGPPAEPAAV
jgi:IS5 family transposase